MWKTFRELLAYNARYNDNDNDADASTLPLDPIQCTGSIDVSLLKSLASRPRYTFAAPALNFITSEETFLSHRSSKNASVLDERSAKKWDPHIRSLLEYGILRPVGREEVVHVSKYFGIPKSNKSVARSIFNGRKLSQLFNAPPPVHLPYLPHILQRMASLNGFTVATGDIRHFFHQIKIPISLQKYFGVALGDEFFVWTQVPMGFSFSPWIAQSIALMILLFREEDEEAIFDEPHHQQLPDWLNIKRSSLTVDEGFVVVFYDNILLASRSHRIGERIFQRISRNFQKFGVVMGNWQFLGPKQLRTTTFEYLGAEVKIQRKRERQQDNAGDMSYKVTCGVSSQTKYPRA